MVVASATSLSFLVAVFLLLKASSPGDSRISPSNPLQGFIILVWQRLVFSPLGI